MIVNIGGTSINDLQVTSLKFEVYPNPNRGLFTISTNNACLPQAGICTNIRITVYDVLGEEIFKSETNKPKFEIDISAHPAGIYHLQLITDRAAVHKKVIIE